MTKVTLWLQTDDTHNQYLWDFCAISEIGAREWQIPFKKFYKSNEIPYSPYNIIIGSVEECSSYLKDNGHEVPAPIDMLKLAFFSGRFFKVANKKEFLEEHQKHSYPCFIKPYDKHKAFTAFIANNPSDIFMYTNGFEGNFLISDVLDIASEYRCYVNKTNVLGMKHYSGDPLVFPNDAFIINAIEKSRKIIPHLSYSLDFGVLRTGETVLIEAQDGWAIGNYGLEPYDYVKFVKDRWLQITNIL